MKGKDRFDVHQHVTDQIITAIENGAGTWQMPWHRSAHAITRPRNIASDNTYRGINILALWVAAAANDYAHGIWGTYRQWQAKGAQVRKGEKSSVVVFYRELERVAEDDPNQTETVLFARASRVFNIDQVEGFTLPVDDTPLTDRIDPIAAADALVARSGAVIEHQGDKAFYRPSADAITLPDRERFTGTDTSTPTEAYYGTLLHELTHYGAPLIMPKRIVRGGPAGMFDECDAA